MNLLIVDDEPYIVDWIVELLQKEMPFLKVFKAYSGTQAVSVLEHTCIDILVSDIRMPKMDGLHLMELVRSRWQHCRILFLTAFSDFDYVYTAIQQKGVRYLLKTEDDSVILKNVRDLYDDILLSGDTPDINGRVDSLLRKERVLNALMQKTIDISAAAAALDMDPSSPLTLTRVFVKNAVHPLPELDMQEMSYRYLKYVIDPIHIPTKEGSSLYAGKAVASSCGEDIRRNAETFRAALTAASGGIVSAVVYEENCTLTALKDTVQRICETEMPSDGITVCPLPQEKRSRDTLAQLDLSRRMARVKDMELLLARGEREKYLSAFDQTVTDLSGSEDCSLIYMAIALQLLEYIRKNALADYLPESLSLSKLRSPEEPIDWEKAYAYARNAASVIFQTKSAASDPEDSMLLLIDHIEKHLDETLSLPELAAIVHYNPSYLSRTFKHRVGVNLNQYILQARIQKACALLKNGGRVNDVAVKVGFRDVRYFSEIFRKQTGKTPQEYRLNK